MRLVIWFALLIGAALAIGAASGVRDCWYGLVVLFVVGECLLPVPPGPKKYP